MMIVGFKDIYILGCFLGCIAGNLYFPAITTIINSYMTDEIRTVGNSIINMIQTGSMCILLFLIGVIF